MAVKVGTVYWDAKVKGLTNAQAKANSFADSAGNAADTMTDVNQKMGAGTDKTQAFGKATERTRGQADLADSKFTVLASTLIWLSKALVLGLGRMLGLGTAMKTAAKAAAVLGGALKGLTLSGLGGGALGGLLGGLLGGASGLLVGGLAGLGLGLGGVKLMQELGVMDAVREGAAWVGEQLPSWLVDGILIGMSLTSGPLSILGGFISGFLENVFSQSLSASVQQGLDRAEQVFETYVGAWERTASRVASAWEGLKTRVRGIAGSLAAAVGSWLRDAWNAVVPDTVQFPTVRLPSVMIDAGPLGVAEVGGQTIFEGFAFNLPQLDVGGLITRTGFAQVHEGETVVPADAEMPFEADPPRGAGGRDAGVHINGLSIEIGDQELDISRLDRMTVRQLVDDLADAFGEEVERRVLG